MGVARGEIEIQRRRREYAVALGAADRPFFGLNLFSGSFGSEPEGSLRFPALSLGGKITGPEGNAV